MALYDDLAWFETARQWIASTYPGKFVLIKDKAVIGAYPTEEIATQAGFAQFGPDGFAVKEAIPFERVEYGLMGRRLRLAQGYPQSYQQQAMDVAEQLRRDGAIVTVVIAAPGSHQQAAQSQGRSAGTPQTVKGMVDTGASISTVSDQVAAGAGLIQTGSVPLGGVGGTSERPIYAASFTLPEWGVTVDPIEVAGVTIPMPGIDILVGRDILRALHLDYTGPQGAFALTKGLPPQGSAAPGSPAAAGSSPGLGTWLPVAAGVAAVGLGALFAFDVI